MEKEIKKNKTKFCLADNAEKAYDIINKGFHISPKLNRDEYYQECWVKTDKVREFIHRQELQILSRIEKKFKLPTETLADIAEIIRGVNKEFAGEGLK